jgi:hypothetical protein
MSIIAHAFAHIDAIEFKRGIEARADQVSITDLATTSPDNLSFLAGHILSGLAPGEDMTVQDSALLMGYRLAMTDSPLDPDGARGDAGEQDGFGPLDLPSIMQREDWLIRLVQAETILASPLPHVRLGQQLYAELHDKLIAPEDIPDELTELTEASYGNLDTYLLSTVLLTLLQREMPAEFAGVESVLIARVVQGWEASASKAEAERELSRIDAAAEALAAEKE